MLVSITHCFCGGLVKGNVRKTSKQNVLGGGGMTWMVQQAIESKDSFPDSCGHTEMLGFLMVVSIIPIKSDGTGQMATEAPPCPRAKSILHAVSAVLK